MEYIRVGSRAEYFLGPAVRPARERDARRRCGYRCSSVMKAGLPKGS